MRQEVDYQSLVHELKRLLGSAAKVGIATRVHEKTVLSWLHAKPSEFHPQADHKEAILKAAHDCGVEIHHHLIGSHLWDWERSFEENVGDVPELYPPATIETCPVALLGRTVRSPFGAAASVLASTTGRVLGLSTLGLDVNTFGSVRSAALDSHPGPHRWQAPGNENIDTLRSLQVEPYRHGDKATNGVVCRFGIPSFSPAVWQTHYREARQRLPTDKLLLLSVLGTATKPGDPKGLIADYIRVIELALEVNPDGIEINTSSPNCPHAERLVYQDRKLLESVVKTARRVAGDVPLVLKIGSGSTDELRDIAKLADANGIQAISAINGVRVIGTRISQGVTMPAITGAFAGARVFDLGIRTIRDLANIRSERGYSFDLIASGGVVCVRDVETYLRAGANAVQVSTVLFDDAYFGLKVQVALANMKRAAANRYDVARWDAHRNTVAATEALRQELHDTALLDAAAVQVALDHLTREALARKNDALKASVAPPVQFFVKQIRAAYAQLKSSSTGKAR